MTIDDLLKKWLGKKGAGERAEYQQFLTEFMQALGVPAPGDGGFAVEDYRFEAPVRSEAVFGNRGTKRADLYKRDCFILEAKQSQLKDGEVPPPEPEAPPPEPVRDLFGNLVGFAEPTGKAPPRYDRLMSDARLQAERYALALPDQHRTPPFLIVADIGRSFELYFDWAGNGRGYAAFPDERSYRIRLADLASPSALGTLDCSAADVLRAVWTDPASIDPRLKAAKVTRDIAERLKRVAAALESDQAKDRKPNQVNVNLRIEETSLFLMRMLFCMFAEDVELLPKDSFTTFLKDAKDRSDNYWRDGLNNLWSRMDDPQEVNRYWSHGDAVVRYFNGNLFTQANVFPLSPEMKGELVVAAGRDWRSVEPAIFGTLLEQVLTAKDRAKLGAHYTPRAYVERLVQATVMDVLTDEWEGVREKARVLLNPPRNGEVAARSADGGGPPFREAGVGGEVGPLHHSPSANGPPPRSGEDLAAALTLVRAFHDRLCAIRILDPACGTGNFLYVAMEQLLRLEGEVRQFALALGADLPPRVEPNQFLGLELNARAAVIAELVLWIGWLRYRLANTPEAVGGNDGATPVLPPLSNINMGRHGGYDAVLARTATGEPDVDDPRRPEWPEADFIVGNPPFIGGKDIRARLDDEHPGYAEALWKANPHVPKSADFVMQWWDRAADLLTRPGTRLRRFGFVTTNSITQVFSRRVIERYLHQSSPERGGGPPPQAVVEGAHAGPKSDVADGAPMSEAGPLHQPAAGPPPRSGEDLEKLHLVLAIPDHPWTRVTRDAAAVRIAMTVAQAGAGAGKLVTITGERGLDTDAPELEVAVADGAINANLTVGTDVTKVMPLKANEGIASPGVKLHGDGFIVTPAKARELGLGTRPGLEEHIREYRNGRDLLQRPRGVMVIDLFGLNEAEVMDRFPEVYQHLLTTVRTGRAEQVRKSPTTDAKAYLAKWWIFGKPRTELRPALAGLPRFIGTSETSKHRVFSLLDAMILPDNMIVNVGADDPSVFGALSSKIHEEWALERGATLEDRPRYSKSQVFDPFPFPDPSPAVAAIAERLDQTRRTALAENPKLTMTGLYNLVEAVRSGADLSPEREAEVVKARALIVAKLHDDLDQAVADAYGWGEEWRRAPLPPGEIVARLVKLNAERAAEEAAGHIRWLRPDYQRPRFGPKGAGTTD